MSPKAGFMPSTSGRQAQHPVLIQLDLGRRWLKDRISDKERRRIAEPLAEGNRRRSPARPIAVVPKLPSLQC